MRSKLILPIILFMFLCLCCFAELSAQTAFTSKDLNGTWHLVKILEGKLSSSSGSHYKYLVPFSEIEKAIQAKPSRMINELSVEITGGNRVKVTASGEVQKEGFKIADAPLESEWKWFVLPVTKDRDKIKFKTYYFMSGSNIYMTWGSSDEEVDDDDILTTTEAVSIYKKID